MITDIRLALRTLPRMPGFSLAFILTLGLGIGANTAIFSVINGVLLKPLPYEHGERLVVVQQSAPLSGRRNTGVSIAGSTRKSAFTSKWKPRRTSGSA